MSDKTNNVINRAYKAFVPSKDELKRLDSVASYAVRHIKDAAQREKAAINVNLGGSYAKGTNIVDKSDIDIFVSFDSEKSTKLLGKLVPKNFMEQRGTRIYYRGKIRGIPVEIVPVVRFLSVDKVENSIDLSVLHTEYVRKRLNEDLRKDIIILKQFCKANGCYGSETFRHGFSGYSLELLVLHYGGLKPLFSAVSGWRPPIFIDPGQQYKDKKRALENINVDGSFLVVIDPTNPRRNVCGSLNKENLAKFVFSVKKFIAHPSIELFKEKDEERIVRITSKKRHTKLFEYSTKIEEPRDRFLSIYNKSLAKLIDELRKNGVEIYDSTPVYYDKEVKLLLEIANTPVTSTRRVDGPEVWLGMDSFKEYLKQHKNSYPHGENASYDKPYGIKDFKRFIQTKLKEYIDSKTILKN
ncbi:MAG: nucleotidyltransferase domain-containing protein [Candidatus Parvarchaeota archaeon]|nr:nucleotidyltransferase domain-containing protein [Candidatus Parvarchaeota archaeon]